MFPPLSGITGTNDKIYPANEMAAIQKILEKSRGFVQRLHVLLHQLKGLHLIHISPYH